MWLWFGLWCSTPGTFMYHFWNLCHITNGVGRCTRCLNSTRVLCFMKNETLAAYANFKWIYSAIFFYCLPCMLHEFYSHGIFYKVPYPSFRHAHWNTRFKEFLTSYSCDKYLPMIRFADFGFNYSNTCAHKAIKN